MEETWICYKSDTWNCTGDFDWGSPLAEQKIWNKGITTYLIFKAREGEAYFIAWAIGSWLISMLGCIWYFSRHQKTCWAESSVPASGRHVASVLHKIDIYFSCSAYCSLWLPQIKSWITAVARLLCSQWLGECERSTEWESQFRAPLRNSHPGQCGFSSVQSLSRVRLFATPWIAARQASLSITISRISLRLTSIESVMPSSPVLISRAKITHRWFSVNLKRHLQKVGEQNSL